MLDRAVDESRNSLVLRDHPVKGHWSETMFGGRKTPVVVELGCGKGEYTVALARETRT